MEPGGAAPTQSPFVWALLSCSVARLFFSIRSSEIFFVSTTGKKFLHQPSTTSTLTHEKNSPVFLSAGMLLFFIIAPSAVSFADHRLTEMIVAGVRAVRRRLVSTHETIAIGRHSAHAPRFGARRRSALATSTRAQRGRRPRRNSVTLLSPRLSSRSGFSGQVRGPKRHNRSSRPGFQPRGNPLIIDIIRVSTADTGRGHRFAGSSHKSGSGLRLLAWPRAASIGGMGPVIVGWYRT
jgi:hypothetical protein